MTPISLSKAELRELFDYREDGVLLWRRPVARRIKPGDVAGSVRPDGRWGVTIKNRTYLLHRVIWAWHHDEWPPLIDHENRNPLDNRIGNLRVLTGTENQINSDFIKGAIPLRGVTRRKGGRYRATIWKAGTSVSLGGFESAEEAGAAYEEARKKLYGETYANQPF